jgi:hypothetical protein
MENITGTRFGTQHNNNIESYRGSSVVALRDGDPESSRTWKTTNQVRIQTTNNIHHPTFFTSPFSLPMSDFRFLFVCFVLFCLVE